MKNVPLHHVHEALGAKIVPFAGYNMPLQYTGLTDEHLNVRNNVGVFDVSHMGEFILKGKHAFDLIQQLTSNDVSALVDGKVQYSCFPNGKGGIVDDLLVYRIDAETYMLVVNASNIDKDWNWILHHNTMGVEMHNISDDTALLAIQGPNTVAALQSLTEYKLSEITYYTFKKGSFAGIDNAIISATGYTGAGGFEIYVPAKFAAQLWNAVFEAGKAQGIKPAGLACRDTLRLEMGFCLYGNDINDTTSPIEAGLGWITKFNKEFTDKALLATQKQNGVSKKLVAFEMLERGIPRQHYPIVDAEGNVIGEVTSGTQSPSLNKGIGMGYVNPAFSKVGSQIFIEIRNQKIKAEVVKLPFYKR
jgi:aminomethyltransferase